MLVLILLSIIAIFFIIKGIILAPKTTRAINEYKENNPEPQGSYVTEEWDSWNKHKPNNTSFKCIVKGILVLFAIAIIWAMVYPENLNRSAYLESFYYTNVNQYETAADLTASYLSEDNFVEQIIAGSIERQQLTTEISNRIAEWRDGIVAYNQILATYQKWDNNILVGIFIPNLDPNLKYLQIGAE